MKSVLALDPKDANALNYIGYTYADLGRNLQEAERLVKSAMEYKPNDGYITDSLGWVYYKQGRYQEALTVLKQAVELVPDDPVILEHLGDTYLKLNQPDKALESYEKALQHDHKEPQTIKDKINTIRSKSLQ
jgi:Tfp pilus assembly protein PilF